MPNEPPIIAAETDHSLVGRVEAVVDAAERSLGSRTLTFCVRTLFWLTLATVALFLGVIALTRFWLVPNADSFRPQIVEELSRLTKQRVALGSFEAGWNGWSPEFKVTRLQVLDAKGRALLELPEVETTISWRSIFAFEPRLSSLTVRSPRVVVRRDEANRLSIAGFDVDLSSTEPGDPAMLEWLLRQRYVQIEGGEIEWQDAWRNLPPLRLRDVHIRLQNDGSRHRMGLRAVPSTAIASPLELRSEFRGSDLRKINEWDGSAYVRVDYANVGELAKYLPLPVDVVRGEGGIRAWFDFDDGRAVSVTTDLVLRDAQLRLRSDANARSASAKTPSSATASAATPEAVTANSPIAFTEVSGRLEWRDENVGNAFERFVKRNANERSERWKLSEIKVTPADRAALAPFSMELALAVDSKQTQKGELRASSVDLKGIDVLQASLAPLLPKSLSSQKLLASPRGQINNLRANWQLDAAPIRFEINAQLNDVAWQRGSLPGVAGLTGVVSTTEKKGSFRFEPAGQVAPTVFERWMTRKSEPSKPVASNFASAQGLTLDFGDWFAEPLNLGVVGGALRWEQPQQTAAIITPSPSQSAGATAKSTLSPWLVSIDAISVANADARATFNGTWRNDELGPGVAKITGKLDSADALAVHRYLPKAVGEATRMWVREAIDGGRISNATFNVEGALWHFPFTDGKHGKFELSAPVSDVIVDYADGWPRAENIEGMLNFRGSSFSAEVQRATIANAQLASTQVRIADMMANEASVEIKGVAQSSVENFLRFIATTPVNRMLDGFTERAKGSGTARLALSLAFPIYHSDRVKVDGEVSFENNRVELGGDVPPLDAVNGRLRFTDRSVSSRELRGLAFGGPVSIDVATDANGVIKTAASGKADLSKVRELYDYPLLDQLRGSVDWKLDAQAATRSSSVAPTISLSGALGPQTLPIDRIYQVGSSPRDVAQPIAFTLNRSTQADGRDRLEFELPSLLHTVIERAPAQGIAPRVVERAVVDLGAQKTQLPVRGYSVRGELFKLDTDAALDLLPALSSGSAKNLGGLQSESSSPDFVNVNVRAERALVFGHVLNEASLRAQPNAGRWRLALRSKEATGLISVDSSQENGAVSALVVRLQRFSLPSAMTEKDRLALAPATLALSPAAVSANSSARWPKLDLTADSFVSEGRELGKLEIAAQPGRDEWRMDRVRLSSADGSLEAKGRWLLPTGANGQRGNGETAVDVALDWKDAGKFMQRFGLPKGVERGEGQLRGELSWAGSPSEFGYDKLDGKISLKTSSGRFTEMDPGIGKLLGVISLQSIPRRLTFNFDDLFGRGYAFDTIGADVVISKGKARTENFEIAGPAARVEIRGDAELDRETAQLRVRVFPSISVATAIGIGLATANPAIGAAAWLGQKLARDPVERLLMSEFEINGSWSNPDVKQTRGVGSATSELRESEAGPVPGTATPSPR